MHISMNNEQNGKSAIRGRLKRWFTGNTGQSLLLLEKEHINRILPNLFGYHIIQLGMLDKNGLCDASRISHKIMFDIAPQDEVQPERLICESSHLPFQSNSVDVVLLPHVLEFEADPHSTLREIERILIGEGHVIILGFNPLSLWGLWRVLLAWREEPPWCGHFFRSARLCDWLGLLGFDMVSNHTLYFRPPFRSRRMTNRLSFMEKLGKYLCPWFGGVFIIVAKKRLLPLTPVKAQWRVRRNLIASGVTEPSTRQMKMMFEDEIGAR